ncbi:glycosyl hydrolase [Streptomyces olivaceus]|uniref:Glycosyl hydrolase n=1 Tax=Streptomyces olivaceus TaxID=47716 RepID=A0ABS7WFP9_STROV|nr:glycosyl hydrolase [Streptomyces olivaceus]MBZ6093609.1 glycosyl hydrolase [Streptomyces olivaceus]MBZ6100678.1 glycosyl hydrolase [Streptomyces olivaceus]MBZ6121776.1 glycosyl hydrolase [Streptomyces olivaceus]MBZ6156469.1 glycosyl hydrolase [Streptomyces olivaceus]MBZ6303061.1 glycosyl hydrolase [Streptomyces olivaceus]
MNDIVDFGLDDLSPVDDDSEEAMEALWTGDLTVLSQHHTTPNGSHSFVLAHDRSVTWGIPGEPQLVAIAVARDLRQSTFTFETSHHATASFAQNWLAERGCPLDRIALHGGDYIKPADDLTLQVEQQIQKSGTRYEVLDTYTSDDNPSETWTLVNDSQATQAPVRLFYEEWNHGAGTYTMREGAFPDVGVAQTWLDERSEPLPEPPEYSDHNGAVVRARIARIALSRSAGTSPTPQTGLDAPRASAAVPVQRAVQGRLL